MSLAPPFVLVDRYEVSDELGRGGHAIVYRAHDRVLDRDVAIKLLRDDAISSDTLARFRQEVQVTAQLEHAHILHVYDTGAFEGRPYIVMELASGRTLAERLEREGQLPVSDAVQIARDVGYALAHAHARGIVHRDVKPENILLGTGGAILADFGIARVTQELLTNKITSTGTAVGTVQYMSPEQLCAEPSIDARSDQYSLACVLYEMLAGVRPHIAATFEGLRLLRMTGRHVPVSAHRPSVPASVDVAIGRALSPMPADRYRNMEELLVALGVGASGEFGVSGGWGAVEASGSGRAASGAMSAAADGLDVRGAGGSRAFTSARRRWLVPTMAVSALVAGSFLFLRSRNASGESGTRDGTMPVSIGEIAAGDGVDAALRDGVRSALAQELAAWTGVRVVTGIDARDTTAVAIVPTVVGLSDSVQVRLAVQRAGWTPRNVSALVSRREVLAPGAVAKALVRLALVRAVDSSMTSAEAPGVERLPTRSWTALRAYVRGFVALRAGQFDSAGARFREAAVASGSGGFAQAELWAAQSGAWAKPRDVASWRPAVESAVRSGALQGMDSLMAVGLQAMSQADFPAACAAYRAATEREPESFVAWYQLGECQRLDSVVVKRPEGLRFRSSHWSALKAYRMAIDRATTSELLAAHFTAPLRVTYAEGSRHRVGHSLLSPIDSFSALPSLDHDTLSFTPIPRSEFASQGERATPISWTPAVRRGRQIYRELTERWLARWPTSAPAWYQRALSLELSGQLVERPGEQSANEALGKALQFGASPTLRTDIAIARVRVALRMGDLRAAHDLSVGALEGADSSDTESQRALGPLAALIGNSSMAARLLLPDRDGLSGIPIPLADSIKAFQLRAVLGDCESLPSAQQRLEAAFRSQFTGTELATQRQRLLLGAYRDAVPCLGAEAVGTLREEILLDRVYGALARHDIRLAAQQLATMHDRRKGATQSSITWDYVYAESWAIVQTGDTIGARANIVGALDDIANMSMFTLQQAAQAAGLRRSLELLHSFPQGDRSSGTASTWWLRARALSDSGSISKSRSVK